MCPSKISIAHGPDHHAFWSRTGWYGLLPRVASLKEGGAVPSCASDSASVIGLSSGAASVAGVRGPPVTALAGMLYLPRFWVCLSTVMLTLRSDSDDQPGVVGVYGMEYDSSYECDWLWPWGVVGDVRGDGNGSMRKLADEGVRGNG